MADEITVKITRKGELPGTVGWLAANAAEIVLGATKHGDRAAWLHDRAGKTIDCLVMDAGDLGEIRLVNRDATDEDEMPREHPYTDAAWAVMDQFIEAAAEHLHEPESLADAYVVTVAPKSPLLAAMLAAANEDPAVRPAIIDYVANGGE